MSDSSFLRKILPIALSVFFALPVMASNGVSSMPIAPICMGLLTDVVVADVSEAKQVCKDINSKNFIWKEEPDLNEHMLAELQALLSKKPVTNDVKRDYPLLSGEQGGPWAYKVSDELVLLLSKIDDRAVTDVGKIWIRYCDPNLQLEKESPETFKKLKEQGLLPKSEGPSMESVIRCLRDLRNLSQEAIKRKKSLLLRVSL